MHIILEGPDGAGKSTLAKIIADELDLDIISGEGPEKYAGEILERLAKNRAKICDEPDKVFIFDRISVVSHPIYSSASKASGRRPYSTVLDPAYIEDWHRNAVCIYCKAPTDELSAHTAREGIDTPEHLAIIAQQHKYICSAYDQWALKYADLIYRMRETPSMSVVMYLAHRIANA